MADNRTPINIRDLVAVLKLLPPDMAVLLVGPHGIGKSHIAQQVAKHFGLPYIDRRLAQMTEGDMIGLPLITDDITRFLPVDWFKKGCNEAVLMSLDEFNRATTEITNGAFQIILDREMNGNKLHPGTRVMACVNEGAHYAVNEMDPACINRFAVFHLDPDVDDWLFWARGQGEIDDVIVDFIKHHPNELRHKDLDSMEPMTAYPTPRGWAAVNRCLRHAQMEPTAVAGDKNLPNSFYQLAASLVGHSPAIKFTKFVRDYSRIITAEDVLVHWDKKQKAIRGLSHDAVVAVIDKIGNHCQNEQWSKKHIANLEKFAMSVCNGEDWLALFAQVTQSKNVHNIRVFHNSGITERIMANVNEAEDAGGN